MITLQKVQASDRGSRVGPLTLTFPAGVHAILADAGDGAELLLHVLAKQCSYRGEVRAPEGTAVVFTDTPLPAELSCAEYIETASAFRRIARDPATLLDRYGLGDWAQVRIANLAPPERKALVSAEALTSGCPLLLLERPLLRLSTSAAAAVEAALALRTPNQTCIFSTASVEEARRLSDTTLVLQQGQALAQLASKDANFQDEGYRIECDDPGRLHSLLARARASGDLDLRIRGNVLTVAAKGSSTDGAPDLPRLITRAAAEGGINVRNLVRDTALPEVVRARLQRQMQRVHAGQAAMPRGAG